jgi:hypothetical protein
MSLVSGISLIPTSQWQMPKEEIRIQLSSELCSEDEIVRKLATIDGPLDVYCWYEGPSFLPASGAKFMKDKIFEPLFAVKKDAKLYLYSLQGWNFKKNIAKISRSTPIGEAINRVNKSAIECIYCSSFFKFCTQVSKESALYKFINEELTKKEWLFKLSGDRKKIGKPVATFFDNQSSLFNCIKDLDCNNAYSPMQYIEGYYLIRESVEKGLSKGQKKIEIAFVLPNDEGKFYKDFPNDIARMLQLDFSERLIGIQVNISFQFFKYGENVDSRPYIEKRRQDPDKNQEEKVEKVKAKEIPSYFDYLSKQSMPFRRDGILKG